jgi:hypothetical protein
MGKYSDDVLSSDPKEVTDFQNPSVGKDCAGIKVGEPYCVERNWGLPIEASSTTKTDPTPTPTKPSNGTFLFDLPVLPSLW